MNFEWASGGLCLGTATKKGIHVTNRDDENLLGGENHDTSCVETEERDFVLIPTGQHLEVCNLQYPILF